ncbi:MAG TPA: hypothetical protein VGG50_07655 [Streptosporangiaceae bacterium]|jgi:hypothetical protein
MSQAVLTKRSLAALAAAATVVLAACSSGGGSSGGTGSAPASASASARPTPVLTVCQDVNSVRHALSSIVATSIGQAPISEIQAVTRAMQTALADLSNTVSGQTEWSSQIAAVKTQLDRLQSAASSDASAPPTNGGRSTVAAAKASVVAATGRLLSAVGNRCPAPTSTPVPSSS